MCDCIFLACCGACAAALFVVGFYFFFGIIFIGLASHAKSAVSEHQGLISKDLSLFPNLCITIGALFTLLTVIGLVGERKGRKTRIFYAVAQISVIFLGLYIYIDVYPDEDKVEKHLFEGLNKTLHSHGVSAGDSKNSKNFTDEWDALQQNLECCGVRNYLDWERTPYIKSEAESLPISCCRKEHKMKGCSTNVKFDNPAESNKIIYVQGCLEEVSSSILGRMVILHYFLVPILISTAIGCSITCCSSGVRKDTEMTEKKVGPIIVRTKSKKSKETDVEAQEGEVADVELQKLNPLPEDIKGDETSGTKSEL